MGNVLQVTDDTFQAEVLDSSIPVFVDFWAVWCGPCKMIEPIIEELSDEYEGKAKACKLDLDNNQETAMKYGIRSIPTVLIFKDGHLVDTIVGAVPKSTIEDRLKDHV